MRARKFLNRIFNGKMETIPFKTYKPVFKITGFDLMPWQRSLVVSSKPTNMKIGA
jgi:hypothetical protein